VNVNQTSSFASSLNSHAVNADLEAYFASDVSEEHASPAVTTVALVPQSSFFGVMETHVEKV
jgi:hypothetical protein